jgi:hypothetical protein
MILCRTNIHLHGLESCLKFKKKCDKIHPLENKKKKTTTLKFESILLNRQKLKNKVEYIQETTTVMTFILFYCFFFQSKHSSL